MNQLHQLLWTLAAAGLLMTPVGCASSDLPSTGSLTRIGINDPTPIHSPTATLIVQGLSCPLCASNVDKQLLRVPGVTGIVKVNLQVGQVAISINDSAPPTRGQLSAAVEESGFTLVDIQEP